MGFDKLFSSRQAAHAVFVLLLTTVSKTKDSLAHLNPHGWCNTTEINRKKRFFNFVYCLYFVFVDDCAHPQPVTIWHPCDLNF